MNLYVCDESLQTGQHDLVETQWKLTRMIFTFQSHFGGGESGSVCCLPTQDTVSPSLGGNEHGIVGSSSSTVASGIKT